MLQTLICVVATIATTQPVLSPVMDNGYIHVDFDTPEGQDNRGPLSIPFSGYVDSLAGLFVVEFSAPCGTVQVRLDNLGDGSYVSSMVAGTGTAMIPFSCTSGLWRITITLITGEVYVGEFTL